MNSTFHFLLCNGKPTALEEGDEVVALKGQGLIQILRSGTIDSVYFERSRDGKSTHHDDKLLVVDTRQSMDGGAFRIMCQLVAHCMNLEVIIEVNIDDPQRRHIDHSMRVLGKKS